MAILRQMAVPREFRISAQRALPRDLMEAQRTPAEPVELKGKAQRDAPLGMESDRFDDQTIVTMCTGVWRVRRRMIDPATGVAREDMRMPFRHLESVWDTLVAAGVDIRDHTDEPVPEYGSVALEVLAYQPTPGLSRDKVIDTIKPSIYMDGRLLQMGQVIVGTPEDDAESPEEGTAP